MLGLRGLGATAAIAGIAGCQLLSGGADLQVGDAPTATTGSGASGGAGATGPSSGTAGHAGDAGSGGLAGSGGAGDSGGAAPGGGGAGGAVAVCKRVFVTAKEYSADLKTLGGPGAQDGPAGADLVCQKAVGSGSWVAWISAPMLDVKKRLTWQGPWCLIGSQTKVAQSVFDLLDGQLLAAINETELGAPSSVQADVWTGTLTDGTADSDKHCTGWTAESNGFGVIGNRTLSGADWTNNGSQGCWLTARLYCFEQ